MNHALLGSFPCEDIARTVDISPGIQVRVPAKGNADGIVAVNLYAAIKNPRDVDPRDVATPVRRLGVVARVRGILSRLRRDADAFASYLANRPTLKVRVQVVNEAEKGPWYLIVGDSIDMSDDVGPLMNLSVHEGDPLAGNVLETRIRFLRNDAPKARP